MDIATLAEPLRETEREDARRASLVGLVRAVPEARQNGSSPDEAVAAADRYMNEALDIPSR